LSLFTQVGNATRGGEMGKKSTRRLTVNFTPKFIVSIFIIRVTKN